MPQFLKSKVTGSILALSVLTFTGSAIAAGADDCAQLKDFHIYKGSVTKVESVPEGPSQKDPARAVTGAQEHQVILPQHCLVQGEINPRTGADGQKYSLRFELRMPQNWQHRFIFQGGGGTDGFLANAVGSIPIHGSTAEPALARGFAVVSMNGGHTGRDASFGADQQARLDYAYAAIGQVTEAAKQLVTQYYQQAPQYSYFMGCSNGGREAMMAAQRYPTEFDGVVAANPGFRLSRAAIGEAWDTQALLSIAPKDDKGHKVLARALTQHDLDLVKNAVLAKCDALDGLKDGIINDYNRCEFDPAVLTCKATADSSCLPKEKVAVIKKIFSGAKDSQGNQLYSTWPYDAGVASPGWRVWKLGTSKEGAKPNAINATMGADSLFNYFMTPPRPNARIESFNFDQDPQKIDATSAINDADATFMTTFEKRGGKMMVIEGVSDPVFSADDIRDWYLQTEQDTSAGNAKAMRSWNRLFMIPGMNHCGGGQALDDVDPLSAIQHWVEKGQAPEYLPAKGNAVFPKKSQPICVYPQVAKYNGKGDVNDINSFHCE